MSSLRFECQRFVLILHIDIFGYLVTGDLAHIYRQSTGGREQGNKPSRELRKGHKIKEKKHET